MGTPTTGCIYFVRRLNSMRYVKIGWATWPERRLMELQVGSPEMLVIETIIDCQTKADERALHKRFREMRRSGEWFHVKGALLEYLRDLCGWFPDKPGAPRCPAYYKRLAAMRAGVELVKRIREGTPPQAVGR